MAAPTFIESWKAWAVADAERRGLSGLTPIIEGFATSTAQLRATRWQAAADGRARERVNTTPDPLQRIVAARNDEVAGV